jgi:hypothetical protein
LVDDHALSGAAITLNNDTRRPGITAINLANYSESIEFLAKGDQLLFFCHIPPSKYLAHADFFIQQCFSAASVAA